jgi:hypothetical protein
MKIKDAERILFGGGPARFFVHGERKGATGSDVHSLKRRVHPKVMPPLLLLSSFSFSFVRNGQEKDKDKEKDKEEGIKRKTPAVTSLPVASPYSPPSPCSAQ